MGMMSMFGKDMIGKQVVIVGGSEVLAGIESQGKLIEYDFFTEIVRLERNGKTYSYKNPSSVEVVEETEEVQQTQDGRNDYYKMYIGPYKNACVVIQTEGVDLWSDNI
ncbi:hypothetical protein [Shimazuella kribbensis]|uniref:hypothetical protein n=1 Tax=Shimazuella kribbensis TaxID=139808 RepID=UPI0003FCBAFF|nr:hypothetical protein [Shimazuella kribbensis]